MWSIVPTIDSSGDRTINSRELSFKNNLFIRMDHARKLFKIFRRPYFARRVGGLNPQTLVMASRTVAVEMPHPAITQARHKYEDQKVSQPPFDSPR
jgi:hypothetical protein